MKQMFEGATGLLAGMDEGKVSISDLAKLNLTIFAKLDLTLGEINLAKFDLT